MFGTHFHRVRKYRQMEKRKTSTSAVFLMAWQGHLMFPNFSISWYRIFFHVVSWCSFRFRYLLEDVCLSCIWELKYANISPFHCIETLIDDGKIFSVPWIRDAIAWWSQSRGISDANIRFFCLFSCTLSFFFLWSYLIWVLFEYSSVIWGSFCLFRFSLWVLSCKGSQMGRCLLNHGLV
jgi:hypothetical protein